MASIVGSVLTRERFHFHWPKVGKNRNITKVFVHVFHDEGIQDFGIQLHTNILAQALVAAPGGILKF